MSFMLVVSNLEFIILYIITLFQEINKVQINAKFS